MIKIRMVDSVCFDNWHLQFNSQLIEILSNIAAVVEYRGGQDIGNNKLNVKRKNLYVVKGTSRFKIICRFIFSLLNDVWQLIICPKDEVIVYAFDATISLRLLNILNKVLGKRIIMFRHGSLEMLQSDTSGKGIFYKFESTLTRQFFLNKRLKIDKNIHFFVLGDVILKNLSFVISEDKMKHFHSLDHPYHFDKKTVLKNKKESLSQYNIGTVGVFSEYKGASLLLCLAEMLKEKKIDNIKLSISGKIDFDTSLLKKAKIDLPSNEGKCMVDTEELKNRIDLLDFVLYFYHSNTYRLTASGAIFDAINRKRPIIAIRNDYFEYIFDKFGSLGYLVDSIDEMADIISRISKGVENREDYNFEQIQSLLSSSNLSKLFDNQLREIEFIE